MMLTEIERKGRILTKARFGCLSGSYTLNITRGCEFKCIYCYARGYPDSPKDGEVLLYRNLPEKLIQELDKRRSRRRILPRVVFNTASDSFQAHPAVLDTTYRAMKGLLDRGVGFSFLTKGFIPDRFIRLFSERPELIRARIGLVSVSSEYQRVFEPMAAGVAQRLQNATRLREAGVEAEVRIDPIIPFFTDEPDSIRRLFGELAGIGVRSAALSYLHVRPAILDQFRKELPPLAFKVLSSCFQNKPWQTVGGAGRSVLIPLPLRRKGYDRFKEISGEFGITSRICSCKNPDMPADLCWTSREIGLTFDVQFPIPFGEKNRQGG